MTNSSVLGIELELLGDIVIARWPEQPTATMVHSFFDQMETLLRARPRALILDARAVKSAPISVREAAGRRLKVMEDLFRKALRGEATVLSSALVRGALATVHFFARPKYPSATFTEFEEARVWCEKQLAHGKSGEHMAQR